MLCHAQTSLKKNARQNRSKSGSSNTGQQTSGQACREVHATLRWSIQGDRHTPGNVDIYPGFAQLAQYLPCSLLVNFLAQVLSLRKTDNWKTSSRRSLTRERLDEEKSIWSAGLALVKKTTNGSPDETWTIAKRTYDVVSTHDVVCHDWTPRIVAPYLDHPIYKPRRSSV